MSIDKHSDGVPEVDLERRTTKVNLVMIIAIGLWLAGFAGAIWWLAERYGS